ncbi:MAG: preprotein translocase subunit SecG [Prevotella sp.]|nr:preprotein translocase subunit SecG [Prevotella sp.]
MYILLLIFIIIAAILMVGIVLIQESKGGGLASNFASYNQIGGVRKTTDFIEKMTWGLAAAMVVISIASAYVAPKGGQRGAIVNEIQVPTVNPNNTQGIEASPIQAPATEAAPAEEAPAAENTTPQE